MKTSGNNIAVLGCGNIGSAIALGLVKSGKFSPSNIYCTKRKKDSLTKFSELGFKTTTNNKEAVKNSDLIIVAVTPQQLNELADEIKREIDSDKHKIFSIVSGASIKQIKNLFGNDIPVVRVMPNTAIAIQESMTCISGNEKESIELAVNIFNNVGKTVVINEELMVPATALCACGIAFFYACNPRRFSRRN